MRLWMNEGKSYIAPVGIGDVMRAGAVGKVVASKHPKFAANDYVSGGFGVKEYAALDGAQLTKIDPRLAPLPTFLNALGMPGMTAYFGLLDVGDPKEGDTVVVSAASGAVGATVGQIAKIKGCRAVGIAGGAAKCRYIEAHDGRSRVPTNNSADFGGRRGAAGSGGREWISVTSMRCISACASTARRARSSRRK